MTGAPRTPSFPIGMLLFMLALLLGLSAAVAGGYGYLTARARIAETEAATLRLAGVVADAAAGIAELSVATGDLARLRALFAEKAADGTVREAFYARRDGTILLHTNDALANTTIGAAPGGGPSYPADRILEPIASGKRAAAIIEYDISGAALPAIPYARHLLPLVKRHLYPGIDRSGWLMVRPVVIKATPVGATVLVIGRDRVHGEFTRTVGETLRLAALLAAASCLIALCTTVVFYLRLRALAARVSAAPGPAPAATIPLAKQDPLEREIPLRDMPEDGFEVREIAGEPGEHAPEGAPAGPRPETQAPVDVRRPIKNAIPVKRKR
ncbi:MAG TPA: hypothetical protein PLE73_04310 [Spirochaetota bacterium]|nr:hypothetical protein [Spirochaetota bacterium]HPI22393.1 hypothetical protein [Spirochaetota bacterium]HPU87461.1 hypothetical protein [Spirochaetota bacterium]